MSEMEDQLNSVLNNPQMMQQIMAMAQSMGGQSTKEDSPPKTIPLRKSIWECCKNYRVWQDKAVLTRISDLCSTP